MAPESTALPAVRSVASALRLARRVVVLTGAGVSAESGIATFRDSGGLWAGVDPEDVATEAAFRRDPAGVWEWYEARRVQMAAARPNPAHDALAALERQARAFTLVTQNIDGLHQRAGSRCVIELHGSIHRTACLDCRRALQAADVAGGPPRCVSCGGLARPDVVWFGEVLPAPALDAAWEAASAADVFLSVGTSAIVEPAASLPFVASSRGALVVEVNPAPTALTRHAHYILRGPAGTELPRLIGALAAEEAGD